MEEITDFALNYIKELPWRENNGVTISVVLIITVGSFFSSGVSENDNSLWFVIKGLINQQLPSA